MSIPARKLSGVCEISTASFTVTNMPKVHEGENGAIEVSIRFLNNGQPYSLDAYIVEMYLLYQSQNIMTDAVELSVSSNTATGAILEEFMTRSGCPLLVVRIKDPDSGQQVVAFHLPVHVENVLGQTVITTRPPTPSEVVYIGRSPYINESNHHWMVWDGETSQFKDSGIVAKGETGATGPQGPAGPAGSVTGIQIGSETYEPNESGVVELPQIGQGSVTGIAANGETFVPDDAGTVDISGATVDNAGKLGGKAPEYYLQPRNLLDNSDFRNPVNQRGQTSYSGAKYGIDRWAGNGSACGVDVSDECITLKTTATTSFLIHRIPDGVIKEGATYTIALKALGGAVGVASGVASVGMGTSVRVFNIADEQGENANFRMEYNSNEGLYRVSIGTSSTNGVKLEWAALYEGSYTAETLPPYVPKGYVTELMECQRRCVPMYGFARYRVSRVLADYLYFEIPFPVIMAKTPELSNAKNTIGVGSITGNATKDYTFSVSNMNATSVQIRAEKAGHGLTDAYLVFEGTTSEDGAFLLAEL